LFRRASRALHVFFGNASVENRDGDPLVARLLGVACTGDVVLLATRFLIEYARALGVGYEILLRRSYEILLSLNSRAICVSPT
jgi:hypothetical protein